MPEQTLSPGIIGTGGIAHMHADGLRRAGDRFRIWAACDPDERTNLIDQPQHHHVVDDMRQRMEKWFAQYVDPSRDGSAQPVRGKGQIAAVDASSAGPPAFAQEPGAIL